MVKNILFIYLISVLFSCSAQEINKKPRQNGISFVAPIKEITSDPIKTLIEATSTNALAIIPFAFCYGKEKPSIIYGHKNQWWGSNRKVSLLQFD